MLRKGGATHMCSHSPHSCMVPAGTSRISILWSPARDAVPTSDYISPSQRDWNPHHFLPSTMSPPPEPNTRSSQGKDSSNQGPDEVSLNQEEVASNQEQVSS
ncbi:unnamed protein product [Gadus morhua 'NCC']